MRIVSTSYISVQDFNDPLAWLKRIQAYTGVFEHLRRYYEVISIERINYMGRIMQNGVDYYFIKLNKAQCLVPAGMHRKIKNLKPAVVLVHGLHFPMQVMQLRNKLGRGVKIFVQHHAEKPGKGFKKILQRRASRMIDGYFFTSKEMGLEWVNAGIIDKAEKIHEVMEASSVFGVKDVRKLEGDPVFLWVGRLDANKDPLTVINSFKVFIQTRPQARLYMLYHTKELENSIVKDLETDPLLKASVHLIGKVEHDQMGNWYNAADFIVAASKYEGSGVAVCEAMSCGCIPVLSNIPSFRKMTNEGKCGLLFETGNELQLLEAFNKTISMEIPREREKVLQQFRDSLSFEAIAAAMHQAFTAE